MDISGVKTVLIVDDAAANRLLLKKTLSTNFDIREADNGQEALDILRSENDISLVLLDIIMPVKNGFDTLEEMQNDPQLSKIPVVVVTTVGDEESQIRAFDLGAVDILSKPFSPQVVLHRVKNIISRRETDRLEEQSKLFQLELRESEYDKLTGLYSRTGFYLCARAILNSNSEQNYMLVRLDLDRFKAFNDSFGMEAGDRLLRSIATLLSGFQDDETIFGRLDADHFISLMPDGSAEEIADTFQEWLAEYPTDFRLTASIGVYTVMDRNTDISLMCDRALLALRTVKDSYSNKVAFYTEEMRLDMLEEQTLTGEMDAALEQGQFVVYFQPQINYAGGCLIGAEALVRWNHPTRGLIPPAKFISLFEKNGFISKLDEFVWEQSCAYMRAWLDSQHKLLPVSVSVNISRMDIYNPGLGRKLKALVDKYGLPPASLRLEITESVYMSDSQRLTQAVEELKAMGFTVEMDDFGSGYSSLNMLKDVPVDLVKLDMRFLSSSSDESRSGNILSSVIRMAHWLKLPVIAEGVETKEQADFLKNLGACYMQGYYFGKPMPAQEFEDLLREMAVGPTDRYKDVNIDGMAAFWDASAQNALVFNSFVGGAVIAEYHDGRLEGARINDNFFKIIGVSRKEYESYSFNMLDRLEPEYLNIAETLAAEAIRSGEEYGYDLKCKPLRPGEEGKWLHVRGRLLAKSLDRYIVYIAVEDITERKKLEQQLAAASRESAALIANNPGGVMKLFKPDNGNSRVVFVSDAVCSIFGADRATMMKKYYEDLYFSVHEEDRDRVRKAYHKAIAAMDGFNIQYRVNTLDGKSIWVDSCVSSVREEKGISLYTTFTDITDIKLLSRQLENDKLQMHSIIRSIPGGASTFEIHPAGIKLIFCSDGVTQLTGLDPEEYEKAVRTGLKDNIFPPDYKSAGGAIKRSIEERVPIDITFRFIHTSGRLIWVNMRGGLVDQKGGYPLFHLIFHNISTSAELYQDIVDKSSTAALVADYNTREILYVNAAAAAFAGKSVEEAVGKKCYEYMTEADSPCSFCSRDNCQLGEKAQITRNDRHYSTAFQRVEWNGHDAFIQYINDITDSWRLEKIANDDRERLQMVIENVASGVAVYAADASGNMRLLMYNQALSRVFDTPISSGADKSAYHELFSRIHPEDVGGVQSAISTITAGSGSASAVFRLVGGDGGKMKWIYLVSNRLENEDGSSAVFSTFTDITETKALEERVRREKLVVDIALEAADLAMWTVDISTGKYIDSNQRATVLSGGLHPGDDYRSVIENGTVLPDSLAEAERLLSELKSGAQFAKAVIHINGRGTGVEWMETTYSVMPGKDGDAPICVGIARDITNEIRDKKRYEEELEYQQMTHSRDMVASTCSNLTQNVVESVFAGRHKVPYSQGEAYDEAEELYMTTAATEEGARLINEKLSRQSLLAAFARGERELSFEYLRAMDNKMTIWVSVTCKTFAEPGTGDIKAFIYTHNIDERKTSQQIINRIMELGYESLGLIDIPNNKIYNYRSSTHRYDKQKFADYDAQLGDFVGKFVVESEQAAAMDAMSIPVIVSQLADNQVYRCSFTENIDGESRRYEYQYVYIDETRSAIIAVSTDITELFRQQEWQHEAMRTALSMAEKANAAKNEFLSRMSHEIRTPMNAILGLTYLTRDLAKDRPDILENLDRIGGASDFLMALLNDVLDMSRIEQKGMLLHPMNCTDEEFVDFNETMLAPLCKKYGVEFVCNKTDYTGSLFVDKMRLKQLILNLVSNAAKYTPEGGRVEFTSYIESASIPGYKNCIFIIKDNGIGMSKEFQQHMFEPFNQENAMTASKTDGTGLGLPICRSIVEAMGGELRIDSEQGRGTTVTVALCLPIKGVPNQQMDAAIAEESYRGYNADLLKGKRVLLVEDNDINTLVVSSILKHGGMEVECAANGMDGVNKFADSAVGYYDAILMDICMPVVDGLEATRLIRAMERPDAKTVPIIAESANTFRDGSSLSTASGMNAHISKPVEPAIMFGTLSRLMSVEAGEEQ